MSRSRQTYPAKPKITIIWPFTEEACQCLVLAALDFNPRFQALRKPCCLSKSLCWDFRQFARALLTYSCKQWSLVKIGSIKYTSVTPPSCRHTAHTSAHVTHLGTNSKNTPKLLGKNYKAFLRDLSGDRAKRKHLYEATPITREKN